ncbi:bifunctional preprotein translocase subunit SecD/SecF [Prevotella disiens]|uniref:Bifunctional preprotein translocase subunit SecD/SecF n=1 Tax=Prevotella disiens TaxID=28130 RepID=A0A379DYD3_9BACT|nr:MMPL family transporter [Prevotella disiens]SUB85032.1 bifunctional preprotein translocase subunit SecD/SecF [Prevotella disiens]
MKIEKINRKFRQTAEWILRHRLLVVGLFALLVAFSFVGTKRIVMKTSFDDYFMSDDPMLLKTDEFKSIFGNDYYVAVLVKNKDVFSKRSLTLIRELSNELKDSLSYADKVTSLTDLEFAVGTDEGMTIEQIVPEQIPSDAAGLKEIRRKAYSKPYLSKKLVSKDGTMTWIMVKLRPFPADSVWKKTSDIAPDMLTGKEAGHIIGKAKYAELSPAAAGMPYMSYEKFVYLKGEMGRLFAIAFLVSIVVMIVVTRSLRGVVAPLITSICALLIGFGIIGWTGLYIDMSTAMIAVILTFACSIAYNIHLYNFFKTRFVETGRRKASITDAVGETGWGVLLSGLTTVAAMMTFLSMSIVPMKAIGLNTSLCLLSVLLTCLVVTPVLLSLGRDRKPHANMSHSFEGYVGDHFERFGGFVMRNHRRIVVVSSVLTLFCGIGLFFIEPAFDVEKTMGRKVEYVKKFLDLCDTELGSMYSYDLMITLPHADDAKKPENLKRLDQLATITEGYLLTKRHNSVTDIIKDMNCTLNGGKQQFYRIPDDADMVAQLLLLYENAGGTESEYWMDYDYRRLRLQVEIKNYNSNEAEKEMDALQAEARRLFPQAHISMVGNIPQFTVMQQYVERGQMWSMLLSVLVIGVILVLVFSSWKVGLVGMIPNLAPAVIVGGMMGWLDYPLDMMTASLIPMILGIAVDDTIHFINHSHVEYNRCGSYADAIKGTFRTEGLAIVMSTVVVSATFAGFMSSNATQMVNWGILAVAGMVSALLADLFLTPVLFKYLRVFGKEKKTNSQ